MEYVNLGKANDKSKMSDLQGNASEHRQLRLGVADNFQGDPEITAAFNAAVDKLRTLGHEVVTATAPFDIPQFGNLTTIEEDRRTISERAFKNIDVLLLPTTTTTVPSVEQAQGKPQFLSAANTMFANYFGLPAISVPAGFYAHGLPIGFQIVGRPWEDDTVLALTQQYEAAVESSQKRSIP